MKIVITRKSKYGHKNVVVDCDNVYSDRTNNAIIITKDNNIIRVYDIDDVEKIVELEDVNKKEKTVNINNSIKKATTEKIEKSDTIQIIKNNLEDIYSTMNYKEKMSLGYILKSLSLFLKNNDIRILKELSSAIDESSDIVNSYFYLYCILKLMNK